MKQMVLLCFVTLLLMGCEGQKTCPVCLGEGTVNVYGEEQRCLSCEGDGKLSEEEYETVCDMLDKVRHMNQSNGNAYSNERAMATCPFCNGRGTAGGVVCGFCNGVGQVEASAAAQGKYVIGGGSTRDLYPSSSTNGNDASSSDQACRYCHGTGDCQHCKGVGLVGYDGEYNTEGGVMKCPICNGTKRCNVCHGTGEI